MYKIETHLHTNHVSKCGWLDAETLAAAYAEAGYAGIAVTDHYNDDTWSYIECDIETPGSKVEKFLDSFYKMQQACAKYNIVVYMGAELRFRENENDYLFYGFDKEVLARPNDIQQMGIVSFSKKHRNESNLLIQAHPFRGKCVPVDPYLIDGLETYNGNPRHQSRNDYAVEYADHFKNMIRSSGSDCHRTEDIARAGIACETLPKDTAEFVKMMRSGKYELVIPEAK